ncbi:MAG: hypothetical protein ACKVQR_10885 [Aquabacterium sp.]
MNFSRRRTTASADPENDGVAELLAETVIHPWRPSRWAWTAAAVVAAPVSVLWWWLLG